VLLVVKSTVVGLVGLTTKVSIEYTRDTIYFFKRFIVSFMQTLAPLVVKSTQVRRTTKVTIEFARDTIYFF